VKPEQVLTYLEPLAVRELHTVGRATAKRLEREVHVRTVRELRALSTARLCAIFGPKTGETLHRFARGIDHRPLVLENERKSVGVDLNWGLRFETQPQVDRFVRELVAELYSRVQVIQVAARHICVKVMKRRPGEGESYKHLGHGVVDKFSRSRLLAFRT
jgi:DNA repair protein REV1